MNRLAILMLALAIGTGCIDIFRGAVVQANFARLPSNDPGRHYTLFAVIGEGAVEIATFKVLDSETDCSFPSEITVPVQLIQIYDDSLDLEAQCDAAQRIGTVDKVDVQSSLLVGGMRLETGIDLRDANALFITQEPDGESDPAPSEDLIAAAVLGRGIDPYDLRAIDELRAFCEASPDSPSCADPIPDPPRERRGVLVGTFESDPVGRAFGRVAVVPAEDKS